jgi:hypothetical protein
MKPNVKYYPPDDREITRFSRAVCHQLAADDPAFDDTNIMHGLAEFLGIVANALVKQHNNQPILLTSDSE